MDASLPDTETRQQTIDRVGLWIRSLPFIDRTTPLGNVPHRESNIGFKAILSDLELIAIFGKSFTIVILKDESLYHSIKNDGDFDIVLSAGWDKNLFLADLIYQLMYRAEIWNVWQMNVDNFSEAEIMNSCGVSEGVVCAVQSIKSLLEPHIMATLAEKENVLWQIRGQRLKNLRRKLGRRR